MTAPDEVAVSWITGIEVETPTFMPMGWRAMVPPSTTGKRAACRRCRMTSPGSPKQQPQAAGFVLQEIVEQAGLLLTRC